MYGGRGLGMARAATSSETKITAKITRRPQPSQPAKQTIGFSALWASSFRAQQSPQCYPQWLFPCVEFPFASAPAGWSFRSCRLALGRALAGTERNSGPNTRQTRVKRISLPWEAISSGKSDTQKHPQRVYTTFMSLPFRESASDTPNSRFAGFL